MWSAFDLVFFTSSVNPESVKHISVIHGETMISMAAKGQSSRTHWDFCLQAGAASDFHLPEEGRFRTPTSSRSALRVLLFEHDLLSPTTSSSSIVS